MAVIKPRHQGTRIACDRCYRLKERCERATPSSPCDRCARLDQACMTDRPILPTGRRKKRQELPPIKTITIIKKERPVVAEEQLITRSPDAWLLETPEMDQKEKELLTFILEDLPATQYSVVSARFKDEERDLLAGLLPDAWPILKDAYLAYATVLKSLHPTYTKDADDNIKLRHVTSAMLALRNLTIVTSKDAKLCLALGFALAFSVYATIGVGVSDICRHCLSSTERFITDSSGQTDIDPQVSFFVLMETMESLVYRRKPTLRIPYRNTGTVDRYLGLSVPLLPFYYDLCVVSHALGGGTATRSSGFREKLEAIQSAVEKWQPSPPAGFMRDFSATEVVQLLAQAKVYRLAALLITHRLQFSFGQQDSQADTWSREVMMELELARQISDQSVRFVTLPFIVAAVETRDVGERCKVLKSVELYVDQFSPVVQKATKKFLPRVWNERDLHPHCSWFDSIHKPCVAFDQIEASLFS